MPEVDGIDDKTAIKLLTKLIDSLNTEGQDSTVLEVDVWLSAGNTHTSLQRAHEVLKEYLLLQSERSASQRSMHRLQREMRRLQDEKSIERENASAVEQELLSQVEALQEYGTHLILIELLTKSEQEGKLPGTEVLCVRLCIKQVRKFEERPRAATTIKFNHNPLPTPPEPFPIESLPFLTNLQHKYTEFPSQSSPDRTTQSAPHLSGKPANQKIEGLVAASQVPSTDQTSIPSNPITVNEHMSSHRNTIIPGASPNQRYIPRTVVEESFDPDMTSIYEQSTVQVDPFVLATDYFVEYAAGYQEGYQLSHQHLQSSRQKRRERRSGSVVPPVVEPTSQASASSDRTLDDRLVQQSADSSATSQPVRRPLGLQDFYSTPASLPPYRRDGPALTPRVSFRLPTSSLRPSTPPRDGQSWLSSNWPTLSPSLAPTERSTPSPPVDRTPNSSLPPTPPSTSASSNSGQSTPPPQTSAPFLSVNSAASSTASSRWSRRSSLSRAPERRSGERTSVEVFWNSVSDIPASNTPDARSLRHAAPNDNSSVQRTPLHGVIDSPASARTIESWGTVSTRNLNSVFHRPRPFLSAYQIESISDLELRFFDDLTDSSQTRTTSQRSSLLSDVEQQVSRSHIGLEDSDNVGTSGSSSQNRTPRVVPRPLPRTESLSSIEGGLPPFVLPRNPDDIDNHWNISNATHLSHRNHDHYHNQHHGFPSDAPETWHRARAHLTSSQSHLDAQSYSHSHSVPGPVSDGSSRTLRQRTSGSSSTAATHDNPASLRWQNSLASTNVLGLTDLTPPPEPRISAPTPITPSQPFLHYYSGNSR
ncbi:hypothetical protein C0992_011301 [Termitomyces sp. T32_za158]|nr:hypothetical protein C0992_011301 [Termitomyces sp. T32_za158]